MYGQLVNPTGLALFYRLSRPTQLNRHTRNTRALCASAAAAAAYSLLLATRPTLTGEPRLDAAIGVVLGLYTCSHPAANAIDVLFYSRGALARTSWRGLAWLSLNVIVILVGWLAIVGGVTRLVR
jgi:hypothetical protein